jgi:putative ABC transport system permease protein
MNQSAVQAFGFEEPLGKEIVYNGDHYQIVGIMEDFNFDSPVYPIEPLVIFFTETADEMIVSYQGTDPQDAIRTLEATWDAHVQGVPLDYNFLDDDFAEQFAIFETLGQLFKGSTIIAILIACLGLIGLSTYMAERKTKEIGIRKVLGASVVSILRLFSGEFVKLILIAFILAAPLSVYFMQDWLTQFAYRIDIGLGTFVFAGVLSLLLVVLAIGWQALKAALMNPVDSIRNE